MIAATSVALAVHAKDFAIHLVYGSDYPYVGERGVKASKANVIKVLNGNPATRPQISNILSGNAAKLFDIR